MLTYLEAALAQPWAVAKIIAIAENASDEVPSLRDYYLYAYGWAEGMGVGHEQERSTMDAEHQSLREAALLEVKRRKRAVARKRERQARRDGR